MKHLIHASLCALTLTALPAIQPAAATEGHLQTPKATTVQAAKERSQIISEAVIALNKTHTALRELEAGNQQKSMSLLADAIGKLEVITAADPSLSLAPVDVSISIRDYQGDVKSIKEAIDTVSDLLDDNEVQSARHMLDALASEVDVRVTNIPLATYPDAIKSIIPLIQKGKTKEAAEALQQTLSTLVIVDHITPLPVLHAQDILAHARKIVGNHPSMSKTDAKTVKSLLVKAESEIERAKALGYIHKDTYKLMLKDIHSLEKKVDTNGDTRGLLKSLRNTFDEFLSSLK